MRPGHHLRLTLTTHNGATGTKTLAPAKSPKMEWDCEDDERDHTYCATLAIENRAGEVLDELTLTGDAWCELENCHDLEAVVARIQGGMTVEDALRAELDRPGPAGGWTQRLLRDSPLEEAYDLVMAPDARLTA